MAEEVAHLEKDVLSHGVMGLKLDVHRAHVIKGVKLKRKGLLFRGRG
jgi:hypothetical protein